MKYWWSVTHIVKKNGERRKKRRAKNERQSHFELERIKKALTQKLPLFAMVHFGCIWPKTPKINTRSRDSNAWIKHCWPNGEWKISRWHTTINPFFKCEFYQIVLPLLLFFSRPIRLCVCVCLQLTSFDLAWCFVRASRYCLCVCLRTQIYTWHHNLDWLHDHSTILLRRIIFLAASLFAVSRFSFCVNYLPQRLQWPQLVGDTLTVKFPAISIVHRTQSSRERKRDRENEASQQRMGRRKFVRKQ